MKKRMLAILLCIGIILSMTAMTAEPAATEEVLPETAITETEEGTQEPISEGISETETVSTSAAQAVTKLPYVAENIQMNLFNYGPLINDPQPGQGFMPFTHSEGSYGWAVDSSGNLPSGDAGGYPPLSKQLTAANPFPNVTADKNTIKAGSLQYLFDPAYTTTGRIPYETYKSNISSLNKEGQNPYQYHSIYFPVSNSDGSGTGLFQKEGNYFVYDSGKNAAWYNPETQKFELYDYVVRPAYTVFSTAGTNGNFLPFNQGHDSKQGREDYQTATREQPYKYTDPTTGQEVEKTRTEADPETVSKKPSGALTAYRLWGKDRYSEVDLWFGMNLEFDFNQPAGGAKNGEAMVFEFLGDDDVFVYIDNVLILDIGGTHGAQTGKINFATGAVTNPAAYGQYGTAGLENSTLYALMKNALGNELDESQFIDSNGDGELDTFKDYTTHNLKFYYLERGGNISYCKLKFNMDPLPTGNVTLEKQVEGVNEAITDDQEYSFIMNAIDADDKEVTGISYVIYSTKTDATSDPKYVDHGETIKLKAFERAVFTNLPVGTTISFTEAPGSNYELHGWTCNNATCEAGEEVTVPEDGAINFVCTNTRYSADLSIAKELTGGPEGLEADYSFAVKIKDATYTGNVKIGEETVAVGEDGVFELEAGQTAVIADIPTGFSYTVTEGNLPKAPAGYEYEDPVYKIGGAEGTTTAAAGTLTADTTVTVTNELTDLLGDLTITKSGIDDLDYHNKAEGSQYEAEYQSTIYVIEGTSDAGESIKMEVVIHDNGSVTIKDLPVGTYTVTEKTDWAWRYNLTGISAQKDTDAEVETPKIAFKLTAAGETVEFVNTRNQPLWLGGDHFLGNLFDAFTAANTGTTTE